MANIDVFKGTINTPQMVKRLTSACGTKEAAFQFMASMLDLYESDGYLQRCDPDKVAAECIKAASLHLPLLKSLGYAYVVPYKNTPTFIVGYKGLLQLALRSGQYKAINADCVYEGEEITVDRLSGMLSISGNRISDTATGYFAYFRLLNGFEKVEYMTAEAVRAHAKRFSKAYNNGPWQTDFDAMALKTVLRKALKYGPMTAEMQEAERAEIQAAENAAKAEIAANANSGPVIDVAGAVVEDTPATDPDTGEVMEDTEPAAADQDLGDPDF